MFQFVLPILFCLGGIGSSYASYANCGIGDSFLPVSFLKVEPPDFVASHHQVIFSIQFTVPPGTYIPSAKLALSISLHGATMPIQVLPFRLSLTKPQMYWYEHTMPIPLGVWGQMRTDMILYNASGSKLLCIRWDVFANNRNTNDTIWLY